MAKPIITHKELLSILNYNPETGVFIWKKGRGRILAGDIAGNKNKQNGYVDIRINYRLYKAHRLAWLYMTGKWPKCYIDHINRIRDDNRFSNLRDATKSENPKNKRSQTRSSSKYLGVSWSKIARKWRAECKGDDPKRHIGYFDIEIEAAIAYDKAASERHGEFANLNFPKNL